MLTTPDVFLKKPEDPDVFGQGDFNTNADLIDAAIAQLGINVKSRGAIGDGVADDQPEAQASIDRVAAAGGGVVYFPPGDYRCDAGLSIPLNKPIKLLGAGMGIIGSARPSRIIRQAGVATLVSCIGNGQAVANRGKIEVRDLEFDGGGTAGLILDLQRCNESHLDRWKAKHSAVTGVRFRELWNCTIDHFFIHNCGNGITDAAFLFDSVAGAGSVAGCNTVLCSNGQFEGNYGKDLSLGGSVPDGSPTVAALFSNTKFEGPGVGGVPYPHIDLAYAQNCMFVNTFISGAANRYVPYIQSPSPSAGARSNKFVNLILDGGSGPAVPYYIDHTGNQPLLIAGVSVQGVVPTTAVARVGAGVAAGRFQLRGAFSNIVGANAWVDDQRAVGGAGSPELLLDYFHELSEIADPPAPPANRARPFVRDNGAGKTQFCVRFPTGAVQVIATEP